MTHLYDNRVKISNGYIDNMVLFPCMYYIVYTSAVGQTVGAFHRRDGRGDDAEILVARLIDRPIRPMITEVYI